MHFIDSQKELDKTIQLLAEQSVLYMDTEFYRRDTYYAKLCLIQISTLREQYVIDTLANLDLQGYVELMTNRKIIKVFHSVDQDAIIFYHMFGKLPRSIFDTQIAATVSGFGKGVGYSNLCKNLLDIEVDKSNQVADWQKRPLSPSLLDYAVTDVIYLIPLYDKLKTVLRQRNLWQIYKQQMTKAISEDTIAFSPHRILNRMRVADLNAKQRNILLELISFREDCAKQLNLPRNHFIHDQELIKMAVMLPRNAEQLARFELSRKYLLNNSYGEKLLALCIGLGEHET